MDLDKIERLVKIIENSSITDFSIKEGNSKITLSRRGIAAEPYAAVTAAVSEASEEEEEENTYITSPIVGTFYAAPSPDAKPYVHAGDKVRAGQTVCILEAMKLMNEIDCEFDCQIEAVLVSNEQKVEYGQPLFRVKKLYD